MARSARPMRPAARSPQPATVAGRAVHRATRRSTSRTSSRPRRTSPEVRRDDGASLLGVRTVLAVPLLREGVPIGVIMIAPAGGRGPSRDKQIELLEDLRRPGGDRDRERAAVHGARGAEPRRSTEALEQQTATGEILRVIASSPTDVQPVFDDDRGRAPRGFCGAASASIFRLDGRADSARRAHGRAPERSAAASARFPGRPVAVPRRPGGRSSAKPMSRSRTSRPTPSDRVRRDADRMRSGFRERH